MSNNTEKQVIGKKLAKPMLQYALAYAKRGWKIIPLHTPNDSGCSCRKPDCPAPGKHPRINDWPSQATCDPPIIRNWWTHWPDANIGIVCGAETNLVVLDVDKKTGGLDSLRKLIEAFGPLPVGPRVRTGGGGLHIIFQHPGSRVKSRANALAGFAGIDCKGDDGYIVAPPSLHASGNRYLWLKDKTPSALPLPEIPKWLLEKLQDKTRVSQSPDAGNVITSGMRNSSLTRFAGAMRNKGMTEEAIKAALLKENRISCQPPLDDTEVLAIAQSISKYEPGGGRAQRPWPKVTPLPDDLPPVSKFDPGLLPASLRPLVIDTAERMQVPLDYPAVTIVLCVAGAVNRRVMIQPKANDSAWVVVPNLWGGIIAPPGFLKTPVIQAITGPLNQIQVEWRKEHEEALKDYARAMEEHGLRHDAWKQQYKASMKAQKAAPQNQEDEPEKPTLRRIIVNDSTFEAMHNTMSENPAGIFVIRDELTGWWAMLDRAGREGERAFCLQAWDGNTGYTIDRIGRGTVHVDACCMSMLGGIQPGRLRAYLADALHDGPSNDGLIQRFQLLVWPDTEKGWSLIDREPNFDAEEQARRVFCRLVELPVESQLRLKFSPEAQELFYAWLADLEEKVRGEELHPALISHLSKYRSLMPSLALLFELTDRDVGFGKSKMVSTEHARQAAAWCDYLESHARRVYSCITTPQLRAARELAAHIKRRDLPAEFSRRDVYMKAWSGLGSPEVVEQALELLEDAGWVRSFKVDHGVAGGRPSPRYEINPGVWE